MTYLKYAAYGVFALGALNLFLIFDSGDLFLIGGVIWAVIAGLALMGASEALGYLRQIRDALVSAPQVEAVASSEVAPQPAAATRSAEEITADIARLKAKQ